MVGFRSAIVAGAAVCVQGYVLPGAVNSQAHGVAERTASLYQEQTAAMPEEKQSGWSPLAFGAVIGLFAAVVIGRAPAAMAADLENGESVFTGNCAACHAGGNNTVVPEKKLKKEALQTYGKYEVAAIIKQVTYGNGAMPAFGERLGPDDIEDVANYVRGQADKGW